MIIDEGPDNNKLWNGEKMITRIPYYINKPYSSTFNYPWHYLMFSQRRWYQCLVGGVWYYAAEDKLWIRMQDRQKQEFCHDHCTMEPCEFCLLAEDMRQ